MKKYMKEFTNNEWHGKLNKNGIEIELILSCNIESDNEPVLKIYFENELYCIHSLSTRQLIIVGNELLDNLNCVIVNSIVNSEEGTIEHVYKYLDSFLNRDFVTELDENLNIEETMKRLGMKKYNM